MTSGAERSRDRLPGGGGCSSAEPPFHPERISDGEDLPVVVEVREHVDLLAPAFEALRPLLELRLRVVAAAAARAVVEAHERPVGREDLLLERPHLRAVADHERDVVLAQQRVDVVVEPRRVPELETVLLVARELRQRVREPFVVALERRRQLPEQRTHLRTAQHRFDAVVEALESETEILQPLDVRDVPRDLDREEEARRRTGHPVRDGLLVRQPVEGVVHLDRVEVARVVLEPEARGLPLVELVLPAGVVPAGAAYAESARAICWHRSSVPAAATRERPSRSSGASPNGLPESKSSIARPCSRTSSCAAAMSTERAPLSEQTPSIRPAASWQSEIASEPMIRSRYASPTTSFACSAISDVSVASNARISISSFGRCGPSGSPFRNAPSPLRAVHSSLEPKS